MVQNINYGVVFMNLKDFEYIIEITRWGSISKAAEHLYISQPALSRYLKRLESELKLPLFYKSDKRYIPTAAGVCFLDYAERILKLNSEMEESLTHIRNDSHNMIRIGASGCRGEFLAFLVLPLFNRKYPQYKTAIVFDSKLTLSPMLSNHMLDVILVNTSTESSSHNHYHIADEDMVLVVPGDHPLLKEAVSVKGLKYSFVSHDTWIKYPFLSTTPSTNTGKFVKEFMEQRNLQPNVVSEIANIDMIFSAVESRMGISIVPSLPHKSVFDRRLCYLALEKEQNFKCSFSAVTEKGTIMTPALKRLIEVAREVYAKVNLENTFKI